MIKDILNKPYTIKIDNDVYTLDYDNKGYAQLEQFTGKGLFKLYDDFVVNNNLCYQHCVDIVCCAMMKNHTAGEIAKARIAFNEKQYLFFENIAPITMAFVEPLTPPKIFEKSAKFKEDEIKKKKQMKKAKN